MRKALILVDLQPGFVNERNRWIVPNVQKAMREGEYALVVETVFHAEPGSLWDRQVHWTFPLAPTIPEIKELVPANAPLITKTTKSAFKGDVDLLALLRAGKIEEVHVAGIDTEDCVFATAQESFDYGFPTYVLEHCTASSQTPELRQAALELLRALEMLR